MKWRIYLKHPGGETWVAFTGTRAEAEARGALYLGKPASWNCTKQPNEPNLWDCYASYELFEIVPEPVGGSA